MDGGGLKWIRIHRNIKIDKSRCNGWTFLENDEVDEGDEAAEDDEGDEEDDDDEDDD